MQEIQQTMTRESAPVFPFGFVVGHAGEDICILDFTYPADSNHAVKSCFTAALRRDMIESLRDALTDFLENSDAEEATNN